MMIFDENVEDYWIELIKKKGLVIPSGKIAWHFGQRGY